MSVIRAVPYIEKVMASMSDEQLTALQTVVNSGGDNVKLNFDALETDYAKGDSAEYYNNVTPAYFQLDDTNLKTGILIWTSTYCTLVCYHRFQTLMLLELDYEKHIYQKINQYCDIEEFRRALDDIMEQKGMINTTGAEAGQILTADGDGGVDWKDPDELTLKFTNVTASTWVSDATYADYGYKCDITCTGITANSVVEVVFGMTEATSGNYAPVCATSANTVTIYAKVNDSITIPVIKEI